MEKRAWFMAPATVFLADDHTLFRGTLRFFLEQKKAGLSVVGEAATAAATLSEVPPLRPDIVLLDLALPDGDGVEVARALCAAAPALKIIALTMYPEETCLLPFLDAGGAGYVHKAAADTDLLTAIAQVLGGDVFLSAAGVQVLAAQRRPGAGGRPPDAGLSDARPECLSEREKQVLRLIAHGYSYREISEALHISASTAETYKCRIAEKLELSKKSELVAYAIRQQIF
jgi:two-component system response regulator NreC